MRDAETQLTFALAMAELISGGQQASAQLALAYVSALAPPVEPPDLVMALASVAVTPESPQATAGLGRLWRLLDDDVELDEAVSSAASYASGVATGGMQAAQRAALDEGVRSAQVKMRWRLNPSPGACVWCQFIADTGARYLRADSVPKPHGPANKENPGGICNCAPAAELVGQTMFQ